MPNADYRKQIYAQYLSGCHDPSGSTPSDDLGARRPYLQRLIRQHVPSDRSARIFELGCGAGSLIVVLRQNGYENVAGVDTSAQQVEAARSKGLERVRHCDLFKAMQELSPQSQDVVVAFDVVEHLTKEEVLQLAKEVHRTLSPGGRWIIHTVNGESPFFGRVRYGDFTHEGAFTQISMRQVLVSAGFHPVTSYEDTPAVHGLKSLARAAVWQVVRSVLRVAIAAETGDLGSTAIMSQNFLTVAEK